MFWLAGGLTLLHGMGMHHIATYGSNRLRFGQDSVADAGSNFPLWMFFVAGGLVTAAYTGSHVASVLRQAQDAQREAALKPLRHGHRQRIVNDKRTYVALVAAQQLDALALDMLFLEKHYHDLHKKWEKTFGTPLSETMRGALSAADSEARGERQRALYAAAEAFGIKPMLDAHTARMDCERPWPRDSV